MHEHVVTLQAPPDRTLHLWFEPWAEGLAFPPGTNVELRASSSASGQLEFEETPERTAVYGWSESTLKVLVNNTVVLSFDYPAPKMLTKQMVSVLFGPPPVPTPEEGGVPRKRPWWRLWA